MAREYATGGLVKYKTKAGLVWRGYAIWRDSPQDEWHHISHVLSDEDGNRIPARQGRDNRGRAAAREAQEAWIDELRHKDAMPKDDSATLLDARTAPIGDYATQYVKMRSDKKTLEPSTVRGYLASVAMLYDGFPNITLAEITPSMVDEWEASLLRDLKLSGTTVAKHHRFLKLLSKHALDRDEIEKDPTRGVRPPKRNGPSPNSLDADSCASLLGILSNMTRTPVVVAAFIAIYTGMREGEICGLQWGSIELDPVSATGKLKVARAIGNGLGGTYTKAPKSDASKREVPISEGLGRVLLARKEDMRRELAPRDSDRADSMRDLYVIGDVSGRYKGPRALGLEWHSLSKTLGLVGSKGRNVTFHDLRHTFATLAIARGADVRSVASILGHSNVSMTLNTYADADPAAKRATAEMVADAIKPTSAGGGAPCKVIEFRRASNS